VILARQDQLPGFDFPRTLIQYPSLLRGGSDERRYDHDDACDVVAS
jgi:hypothetical protein